MGAHPRLGQMNSFFQDIRTIERMKQGPLSPYLDLYAQQLRSQGYAQPSARRKLQRKFLFIAIAISDARCSFTTLWSRFLELLPSGYGASAVAEFFRHLDLS